MAANRWTIRNYNAFLREARHVTGLSYRQAQGLYRNMRDALKGVPLRAADIKRHPRITKREARRVREETGVLRVKKGKIVDIKQWEQIQRQIQRGGSYVVLDIIAQKSYSKKRRK